MRDSSPGRQQARPEAGAVQQRHHRYCMDRTTAVHARGARCRSPWRTSRLSLAPAARWPHRRPGAQKNMENPTTRAPIEHLAQRYADPARRFEAAASRAASRPSTQPAVWRQRCRTARPLVRGCYFSLAKHRPAPRECDANQASQQQQQRSRRRHRSDCHRANNAEEIRATRTSSQFTKRPARGGSRAILK